MSKEKKAERSNKLRFLHLSDFHLKAKDKLNEFNQETVLDSLIEKVSEFKNRINYVLITGDLVFSGKKVEYNKINDFLVKLANTLNINKKNFLIVPGNHDVYRENISKENLEQIKNYTNQDEINSKLMSKKFMKGVYKKLENFYSFINSFVGEVLYDIQNFYFVKNLLHENFKFSILCLNSTMFSGYDGDDKRNLALGLYQVKNATSLIDKNSSLNIVLLHHPFDCYSEYDIVSKNKLLEKANIILFGHFHIQNNVVQLDSNGFTTLANAGTSYKKREYNNTFNILEFDILEKKGFIEFYKYQPDEDKWKINTDKILEATKGRFPIELDRFPRFFSTKHASDLYKETFLKKKNHELSPIEILGPERGSELGSFKEYYYEREEDINFKQILIDILDKKSKKHILIKGSPLSGKSRIIYHNLKNLEKSIDIFVPKNIDFKNYNDLIVELTSEETKIIVLDDLQRLLIQQNFIKFLEHIMFQKNLIIISSCRSEKDYDKVKNILLESHFDIDNIFTTLDLGVIKISTAKKIASEVNIDWSKVEFNGNIGTIFFEISEMRKRYKQCSKEARTILRAIKYSYLLGLSFLDEIYLIGEIEKITLLKKFGLDIRGFIGYELFQELQSLEFIKIYENKSFFIDEVYLEKIIDPEKKVSINDFDEVINIFKRDFISLFRIAMKLFDYGISNLENSIQFLNKSITTYEGILLLLDKKRDSIEYIDVGINLGYSLSTLGKMTNSKESHSNAIRVYKEILESMNKVKYPIKEGNILNNLAVSYSDLANFEDSIKNYKEAIKSAEDASTIFLDSNLLIENAILNINVGTIYSALSKLEETESNCNMALIKLRLAKEVFTQDKYPYPRLIIHFNTGNVYLNLSDVRNRLVNSEFAVSEFEKAEKISDELKLNGNIKDEILYSLGNALSINSSFNRSLEICEKSIIYLEEVLVNFNKKQNIKKISMTLDALGSSYSVKAKITNLNKDYIIAIKYYKKAMDMNKDIFLSHLFSFINFNKTLIDFGYISSQYNFTRKAIVNLENLKNNDQIKCMFSIYSTVLSSLGMAYYDIAFSVNDKIMYKKSIENFEILLDKYNLDSNPIQYCLLQNNLSLSYYYLAHFENFLQNISKAYEAIKEALILINLESNLGVPSDICGRCLQISGLYLKAIFPEIRTKFGHYISLLIPKFLKIQGIDKIRTSKKL